jgi:hypothetical protein
VPRHLDPAVLAHRRRIAVLERRAGLGEEASNSSGVAVSTAMPILSRPASRMASRSSVLVTVGEIRPERGVSMRSRTRRAIEASSPAASLRVIMEMQILENLSCVPAMASSTVVKGRVGHLTLMKPLVE